MKNKILIKTPQYEISFDDLCNKEYMKINNLMNIIESEFNVSMSDYQSLRHEILDISNFVKRLPDMISEVVKYEHAK